MTAPLPTAVSSSPATVLPTVECRTDPYPFFTASPALEPELAEALLAWLETGAEWHLHRGAFYEQWECDLLRAELPARCRALVSPESLAGLVTRIGTVFQSILSRRVTVIAHRLVGGQAIGVHNDDPDPGYETHRLVIQLNRGPASGGGGELLVHRTKDPADVVLRVEPTHNTAFGFSMSARSYHSVTAVHDWTRYTIVFSFWTKEADMEATRLEGKPAPSTGRASALAAALPELEQERLAQLVSLLQSLGAGGTGHSDDNLLAHLVHTYLLLRSWGCGEAVATAGLFHSIYGTEDFREATLRLEDRPLLRQILGADAEAIAYHYCVCSKRQLHEGLASGPPYRVVDARRNEQIELGAQLFRDLILLDLANEIEQQPRVREAPDVLCERRRVFELATPFMPAGAVTALRHTYPS
jgi:hypothetical protein